MTVEMRKLQAGVVMHQHCKDKHTPASGNTGSINKENVPSQL